MSTIIIIFFVLCFLHWIYQSIVVPANELILKIKISDIQHQINTIEKQELSEQDKSVLAIIKPMVENIQNYIQYFNVGTFFELWTKKKQHKKEIKAAKDIILVINACTNPHIRELHSQTTLLVSLTVASSSLPLILYLSPLMILFLIIIAMQGGISRQIQAAIIHLQQRKNKTV
jgi:hypothetical protein